MTARRLFFCLIAAIVALLGLSIFATYSISNVVGAKSQQLAANKAQIDQLTTAQSGIARSKRDIITYTKLSDITSKIVPQDKDQAAAVLQITNIAAASGVALTTITFPSSTLGAAATPAAPAKTPTQVTTNATLTKPNLSQLTPVPSIPGVYGMQVIVGNNGNNPVTYTRLSTFLRGLENNRRTAAVSTISIQPQNNNPNSLVFTLTINIYIKP